LDVVHNLPMATPKILDEELSPSVV
jgi:hypothetical protein